MKKQIEAPLKVGILLGLITLGTGFLMGGILGKFHENLESFLREGVETSLGLKERHSGISFPAEAWAHQGEKHTAISGHEREKESPAQPGTSPAHHLPSPQAGVEGRVSWGMTWLTRFHIHAVGLGMAILLLSLFAANSSLPLGVISGVTWAAGLAGFLHPFGWLLAGILVRTHNLNSALQTGIYVMAPTGGILISGAPSAALLPKEEQWTK